VNVKFQNSGEHKSSLPSTDGHGLQATDTMAMPGQIQKKTNLHKKVTRLIFYK